MTKRMVEQRILSAIAADPDGLSGAEIHARTRLGSGTLYPALDRLENSGAITSSWLDEAYPRRRVYRTARRKEDA